MPLRGRDVRRHQWAGHLCRSTCASTARRGEWRGPRSWPNRALRASPQPIDAITVEQLLIGNHDAALQHRLRNQHAIERVAMMTRQAARPLPWRIVTDRGSKPWRRTDASMSDTIAAAPGSFPSLCFVVISHADAALTSTRLSKIADQCVRMRREATHRRPATTGTHGCPRAGASAAFPSLQLLLRQRLEELRPDPDLALHCPELPLRFGVLDRVSNGRPAFCRGR